METLRRELTHASLLTIVGIVPNLPNASLTEATAASAVAQLYLPMSISGPPEPPTLTSNGPSLAAMSYVVRSTTPPQGLLPSVRRVVDTVDENLAIAQVRTLQELLDGASAQMAFTMVLLAIAAVVSLLLGVVGIYRQCPTSSASERTRSAYDSRSALSLAASPP